ncbi:predicted protein [Uncinocarpus reesii 1704]|uniref:Uncharacterized protein n=1 Tax=Uncinocarpus reesii (strain UAMH 1704) TaxID=336963 RepID=C4JU33_UNCRE|nr:uncharacterized protein UREG_05972 [Uncinocarpus reesii 1704]EEP81130.1 predicted protein [Uncinocarpus reesii 1704]
MAKAKAQKGAPGAAQSHLRARISYLHQAALLFQSAHPPPTSNTDRTATSASVGNESVEQQYEGESGIQGLDQPGGIGCSSYLARRTEGYCERLDVEVESAVEMRRFFEHIIPPIRPSSAIPKPP